MIVFYWIKDGFNWLKENLVGCIVLLFTVLLQGIFANFLLARTCRRCRYYSLNWKCFLNKESKVKYHDCYLGVTKKHFERK